jgi:hypothetical protein
MKRPTGKSAANASTKRPASKRARATSTGRPLDLYAAHRAEYVTPKTPVLVRVGPARYLGITGRGAPGGDAFTEAIGALYGVTFTVKMARKFAGTLYTVSKLEGLWWGDRDGDFMDEPRERWNWQLLIRTPEFVTSSEVKDAAATLTDRGKSARVQDVALLTLDEGLCVQMLHVGPYIGEGRTLEEMHRMASAEGRRVHGRHHEIYLSDPRRVAPERLRTILRLPVI